ncbi:MAG: cyclic pyranopterin monophosphate synthase MoaC, partial [Firmicutes bacterium]|nr:cyclic pyranopterin monophosphate synthase MoaC [Bacillota bacterium]
MELTHFDDKGNARMVDVTEKEDTVREAVARGKIKVSRAVFEAVADKRIAKGDVLTVATTAGIMG